MEGAGGRRGGQRRSAVAGAEAVTLASDRRLRRHAHDRFGIGVLRFGGHRRRSGVKQVEAGALDIVRSLVRDPPLARRFARLFASLTAARFAGLCLVPAGVGLGADSTGS